VRIGAICFCIVALTGCNREQKRLRPEPASVIVYGGAAREDQLQPAGAQTEPHSSNPSEGNAQDISEGQRLFAQYNCTGCHANGGGAIGPPLIKTTWIYGNAPENLFDTIIKGRPNGMPAWGGKIPEYQVWQLVTWIRAMNQEEPRAATPARLDALENKSGTILDNPEKFRK